MSKTQLKRRDFLRALAATGLGYALPPGWPTQQRALAQPAASAPYTGPYWIFLHAGGGWDVTQLCDPKGDDGSKDPVNHFPVGEIRSAGNILYAPVPGFDEFFAKYASRLLVLNGVDTTTNGHDQGVRGTWSGRTAEGYPAFAALVAGTYGPNAPMSMISGGGYENTEGVARAVRLGQNGELLYKLACPSCVDPPKTPASFYDGPEVVAAIAAARDARLQRQLQSTHLPRIAQARSQLQLARVGEKELSRVVEFLPGTLDKDPFRSQLQVAYAAYRAGASVCVNLGMGGFDTHSDHDEKHLPNLSKLLSIADFAVEEAFRQGFGDRVIVAMGSDFGRTPHYNGGKGKDHWPISSMMLMGPGIPGNRVIGRTDERHKPFKLNPADLAPTGTGVGDPGVKLSIEHVHRSLRQLAGIPADLLRRYPLGGEDLPLFNG